MSKHQSPVVLISGGAKRLGAACARHLHQKGYNIAIHYRNSAVEAQQLATELNARRAQSACILQADFAANDCDYTSLVGGVTEHWGRLDVVLNNASDFYPTPLGSIDQQAWDQLMASNLKAPLFLAQAAAPELRRRSGVLLNMLDIHIHTRLVEHAVYASAKAGLAHLTELLALELAPEVRVNAIAPGNILWAEHEAIDEHEQRQRIAKIPLQRQGRPEDIARSVYFLIADAPYITGQTLNVDGGKRLV